MGKSIPRRSGPHGIVHIVARLPIWLYRLGLGWLLDERFLMLTHVGRRSGLRRQVVLEVVDHDRAADTYLIASGWGEYADWLQNIEHTSHMLLHVGRRRCEASAQRLPIDQAVQVLGEYVRRHPLAARSLSKLLAGASLDSTPASWRQMAERVPLVVVRPFR